MDSEPGRLRGSGIRPLPEWLQDRLLQRARDRAGKRIRLRSARYRVTGFRDPGSGAWVSRNPKNGHYYRRDAGRHRTKLRPTLETLSKSDTIALEVELDRGQGPRIYYTTLRGPL